MKVTNSMLAKDLRLIGALYKPLTNLVPTGRELGKTRSRTSRMSTAADRKHVENGGQDRKKRLQHSKNRCRQKSLPHRNEDPSRQTFNAYVRRQDRSEMRILVKKPQEGKKNVPCVLWIHGGGYATGMPEMMYMSQAKQLIGECVLVSPEYRLSGQAPYPAALEDCYLALEWLNEHGTEYGGNTNQIFVGGESAGGGLTAALCLYARDQGAIHIAFQMPLYPMIDNRQSASMKDNDAPIWNEKKNTAGWKRYLADTESGIPEYAVPALALSYKGMPPAMTFVGDIEPFRDETLAYVRRLREDGVPVHFQMYEGCFHAFDMMAPWTSEAKAASEFFWKNFTYAREHYYAEQ